MSIVTKTGDTGTTGLMYNRRVSKTHPRVEAYGCLDELNAALGFTRATAEEIAVGERLLLVQKDLVIAMGELATTNDDLERYVRDGYSRIAPEHSAKLETWIKELEAKNLSFRGWATPGANLHSAALDLARTVCRRAERRVCTLQDSGALKNSELIVFLNRLSDLLWLLARYAEPRSAAPGAVAV